MKIAFFVSLLLTYGLTISNEMLAQKMIDKEATVIALEGKPLEKEVKINTTSEEFGKEIYVQIAIISGQFIASIIDPNGINKGGIRVNAKENEKSKGILYETINVSGEWLIKISNDTGVGEVIINTRERYKEKSKMKEKIKPKNKEY
ncbi:MAG: hypothetical protein SFU99_05010 [Saprospiraceae bacterium]|nr:hypothetical protein [Saprospiraceae bacterium]